METMRSHEFGNGAPKIPPGDRSGRNQPPSGFEGMNYEQKRKPYKKGAERENEADTEPMANKMANKKDKHNDPEAFPA
ncbi:hypothetical protein V9K67_10895 [Paraflavisolibacter sp. H34]|uniref:hypothetical protein n=1 Tax=Huijunlia imazamoxiresistens TaxID=3127457 RepID=UPI00301753E7